jgi:hypothetical protein
MGPGAQHYADWARNGDQLDQASAFPQTMATFLDNSL